MKKRTKNNKDDDLPLSEREMYEQEILRLKSKLRKYEIYRLAAKYIAQMEKEKTEKKRK